MIVLLLAACLLGTTHLDISSLFCISVRLDHSSLLLGWSPPLLRPIFLHFLFLVFDFCDLWLNLDFSLLVSCIQVYTYRIVGTKVLQGEVLSHFVAWYSFLVLKKWSKFRLGLLGASSVAPVFKTYHVQEFLFNCQIVISNRQHSNPILELFGVVDTLSQFFLSFISFCFGTISTFSWQMVHEESWLHNNYGLVGVDHGVVVPIELRQDCTHVQMRVGFCCCWSMLLFDLKSFLQVDQWRSQLVHSEENKDWPENLNLLPIVARVIIVCHCESMVVILRQFLAHFQLLVGLLIPGLLHVLDCQHVADVADLNANVRKLRVLR